MVWAPVGIGQPMSVGTHVHDIGAGSPLPPRDFPFIRLWDARVVWPNLEPHRNQWQFERLDKAVAQAIADKRELLLPLGLSPAWASSRPNESSAYAIGNAAMPARISDWERYVRTVATRFRGKVHHYEIWNEPNKARFFSGTVEQMVALTCAAHAVLKEVDSRNVIVSPGATTQLEGARWLEEFLQRGGAQCIDVVGFHFYTLAHEPPEEALKLVRAVRAAMDKAGVGSLPLWDTEFGWYIANERVPVQTRWKILDGQTAAAYIARAMVLRAGEGLGRAYFYAWNNRYMGAIEPDTGEPKGVAATFPLVTHWLSAGQVRACSETSGFWACPVFLKTGASAEIVWATNAVAQAEVDRLFAQSGSEYPQIPARVRGQVTNGFPVMISRYRVR